MPHPVTAPDPKCCANHWQGQSGTAMRLRTGRMFLRSLPPSLPAGKEARCGEPRPAGAAHRPSRDPHSRVGAASPVFNPAAGRARPILALDAAIVPPSNGALPQPELAAAARKSMQ